MNTVEQRLTLTCIREPKSNQETSIGANNSLRLQGCRLWAISLIEPLLSLSKDWDGYGADELTQDALDASIILLTKLKAEYSIKEPEVFLARDGSVELIWEDDSNFLQMNIIDKDSMSYLFKAGNSQTYEDTRFSIDSGISARLNVALKSICS